MIQKVLKTGQSTPAKVPKIGPTEDVVDIAGIQGGFLLTSFGELIAMLHFRPALLTTSLSSDSLMQAFSRVLHRMNARLPLQILQLPLPSNVEALTDGYALQAFHWKKGMLGAEAGSQAALYHGVRLEAARLISEDILQRTSSSSRREAYVILSHSVPALGAIPASERISKEAELFAVQVDQAAALFDNQGIQLEKMDTAEMLDLLWYAYNPDQVGCTGPRQALQRYTRIFEQGSAEVSSGMSLSQGQISAILADPSRWIKPNLAPVCLHEDREGLELHDAVITPYYVTDFQGAIPTIHQLLGQDGRFGQQLLVSYYIEAPSADEVASAMRKASTTRQAMQQVAARLGGTLPSYRRSEEVEAIENARYGAETQKDVIKFLCLYLGLVSDASRVDQDRLDFEALLRSLGVAFVPATWQVRDIWQTMLPLAHRYHHFEGRNVRASDLGRLCPVNSQAWCDPYGQFLGYAPLPEGTHMPVVIRRERGEQRKPTDAFIGEPGSGKSYTLKFHMINWTALGERLFIIDPKGEFLQLTEMLHGNIISLGSSRRGFNLLQFDRVEAQPGTRSLRELSDLVWEDNLASLITLYEGARGNQGRISGVERRHFIMALEAAMRQKGMDPSDGSTWQSNRVFLSDVYQALVGDLQSQDPATIRAMRLTLEPYAVPQGRYFAMFNTPVELDLGNAITTLTLGLSNLAAEKNLARLALQFALKMAAQYAIRSFLRAGEGYQPYHILIDEASQIIVTPSTAASVARMLSLFPAYGISLHMAFQDFKAIQVADTLVGAAAADSANTLSALIPCFWLFRQSADSAARAADSLTLSPAETHSLPGSPAGHCILAFSGDIHIPLAIRVHEALHPYLCTQPEEGRREILQRLSREEQGDG